ncbi:hypothetical protein CPB83DRAFT_863972 [Crepidotus variabilis]|uniref:Uncharacterized protein n=1 Tax=Crepidotus variabilis TaxID=179855 RepID=A0A9P6E584_9AGAR|nr:hypothetical protein CPB83DRAFT_863972 [Crepidotus variabilis]
MPKVCPSFICKLSLMSKTLVLLNYVLFVLQVSATPATPAPTEAPTPTAPPHCIIPLPPCIPIPCPLGYEVGLTSPAAGCPTCACRPISTTATPIASPTPSICHLPLCPACSIGSTLTLVQTDPAHCPSCSCVATATTPSAVPTTCPPEPTNCRLPCPCGYTGTLTRPATACASCICTQTATCVVPPPTPVPTL